MIVISGVERPILLANPAKALLFTERRAARSLYRVSHAPKTRLPNSSRIISTFPQAWFQRATQCAVIYYTAKSLDAMIGQLICDVRILRLALCSDIQFFGLVAEN